VSAEEARDPAEARLRGAIASAAELLPAQGPLSLFIHHNPLHAFEELPFEQAVIEAAELLGGEPFLSEERYRAELARGRIEERDLDAVLESALGATGSSPLAPGLPSRRDLRRRILRHGVRSPIGAELDWLLDEGDVLDRWRADALPEARARGSRDGVSEAQALRQLWKRCLTRSQELPPRPHRPARAPLRHRDLLLAVTGADSDALVDPLLIRLCAAFLDQGVAYWPMPDRALGLFGAFSSLYGRGGAPPGSWMRGLARELACGHGAGLSALASALGSLECLGVAPSEWEGYVARTLLALRGWAGMLHQLGVRPDRVPAVTPPASLEDLLAVRLLLERSALAHLARRHLGFRGPLATLRNELRSRIPTPPAPRVEERAFLLFELAQILVPGLVDLPGEAIAALVAEVAAFGEPRRRRMLHAAYERRYRVGLLDALAAQGSVPVDAPRPSFQAVFCIDEREESLRRHLEEVEPACETFGYAGFFGVAMYYRGSADAHAAPLCPIAIKPRHRVEEVVLPELRAAAERRVSLRRAIGQLHRAWQVGTRTFARGTLITALFGAAAAGPLVSRVLWPRATGRLRRHASRLVRASARTGLRIERDAAWPEGFDTDEMAAAVAGLLEETGLARGVSRLVVVIGHGSTSLNNPHESAHDCGACGGGRGGANARVFAAMANDPRVRELLVLRGIEIPEDTLFVGAEHDSCSDAVVWADADAIPASHRDLFRRCARAFEVARMRNAHERARRFSTFASRESAIVALAHVEARAEDLAQPRPEYGHATNAACVIGRRSRTRGLFLDRRVFLVSYDPRDDDSEGRLLERILAAVVPVVAGINLEYYFGSVDPTAYGCGTKLPHNVSAMLGVMDGHASDLRTGLPWQMLEIHEPVRLLLVLEARPEVLTAMLARNPALARLVRNRWVQAATLAPASGEIFVMGPRGLAPHRCEATSLPAVGASADWYRECRDARAPARVVATRVSEPPS
jgi:hypothetical protein